MFGNVIQDYDRASSEEMMSIMESCRQSSADLSNLPLHYQSTQQFIVDWCKMNVSYAYINLEFIYIHMVVFSKI